MGAKSIKKKDRLNLEEKKLSLKQKFASPHIVLDMMSSFIKDGDVASITDLISAYISNSKKYKSQDDFAETIGTTRQTLYRMFSHDAVSLKVFFSAIEQIHKDSKAKP